MHEAGIHPRWDTSPLQGSIIHVHLYSFTSRGSLSSPVRILAGFWSFGEVFPQNCATFASMSLNYGLSEFVFSLSLYLVPVCLTLLLLSYIRLKKNHTFFHVIRIYEAIVCIVKIHGTHKLQAEDKKSRIMHFFILPLT